MTAATAIERIVVQATPQEKKTITAKAKKLGMPVSELMRRGASSYRVAESEQQQEKELAALADCAKAAAERASASIDDALAFIAASNKRIEAMEAKAAGRPARANVRSTKKAA